MSTVDFKNDFALQANQYIVNNKALKQYLECFSLFFVCTPFGSELFKVSNGNIRTMYEICLKLTVKTPERRQLYRNHFFEQVNGAWVAEAYLEPYQAFIV